MSINIKVQPAKDAIKQEVAKAKITLTASGGDTWDTGNGSEGRSFTVTVKSST